MSESPDILVTVFVVFWFIVYLFNASGTDDNNSRWSEILLEFYAFWHLRIEHKEHRSLELRVHTFVFLNSGANCRSKMLAYPDAYDMDVISSIGINQWETRNITM